MTNKQTHERSVPKEVKTNDKSYFVHPPEYYPVRGKGTGNLPKGKLYRSEDKTNTKECN